MKQKLKFSIKILCSILLLWFLVHTSKLDFNLLVDLRSSPVALFFTILMYLVVIGISSFRWYKLNSAQHINLTYQQTILPTYLGVAFNNLLPGGVGGDFYRFYFLKKYITAKKTSIFMSILFDRVTGLLGIIIVGVLSASLLIPADMEITLFYSTLLLCLGAFSFYLILRTNILQNKIIPLLKNKFTNRLLKPIVSILEAINTYRNSKKIILECMFASIVIQLLIALTCMMIAKMMHFPPISFTNLLVAVTITQIVNLIPIAPGGFGVGEIAFANILTFFNPGVSASYATIFLAYRILGIILYLPGVVSVMFLNPNLKTAARQTPAA